MRQWLIGLALVVAPTAHGQQVRSTDGAAPAAASIEQLAWLEGSWEGEGLGGPASETYSRVQGGQLTGHFVQTDGKGGIAFTEIIHLGPHGEGGRSLAYRVRHFNPDMRGWEDKTGAPVVFPLIAIERDRWYFDGLTIHREAPDRMTIWVRIGAGDKAGGKAREVAFRYRRAHRP